jgi:hypothetical protein
MDNVQNCDSYVSCAEHYRTDVLFLIAVEQELVKTPLSFVQAQNQSAFPNRCISWIVSSGRLGDGSISQLGASIGKGIMAGCYKKETQRKGGGIKTDGRGK